MIGLVTPGTADRGEARPGRGCTSHKSQIDNTAVAGWGKDNGVSGRLDTSPTSPYFT